MKTFARQAVAAGVALAMLTGAAAARGDLSIQQKLDKLVRLSVSDAPIGEVFDKLSDQTGVEFVIDEDTLDFLPYGDQTRLAVTLKNVTLRKALSPMLRPQALRWVVDGNVVRILPSEPLYRMCRRATYDELVVLGKIQSLKIQAPGADGTVIPQLRKATRQGELSLKLKVEGKPKQAFERARKALPGTAEDWLDMLCVGQDWSWYLEGDQIVVVPQKRQVKRQLQRDVTLRYQNAELVNVLLDLARQAHLPLQLEAGVLNYLPAQTRTNFNLVMADATVEQALELIKGATGLQFSYTAEGIQVTPSEQLKSTAGDKGGRKRRTPMFVKVSLPGPEGSRLEVFIRVDDLPEDVQQHLEKQRRQVIQRVREEVGSPETKPASD